MANRSKIEWTDSTWNPIRARNLATGGVGHFCEHVSEGCRNCYAERLQARFGNPIRYARQDRGKVEIFLDEQTLLQPLRWKKPRMIFVCSMTDLFGEWVPDEWIDKMFAVMALAPQHVFQVLTKRPQRMRRWFDVFGALDMPRERIVSEMYKLGAKFAAIPWPLPNVWLGLSVEDQPTADERIPDLLATPAAVRWASYESALGPVDFKSWLHQWGCSCGWGGDVATDFCVRCGEAFDGGPSETDSVDCPVCGEPTNDKTCPKCGQSSGFGPNAARLDWIVCGGESGPGARPMHPAWARSVRDQCAVAGVPFFFKQWGENAPTELVDDERPEPWRRYPDSSERWSLTELSMPRASLKRVTFSRLGKHRAGRWLDGVEHNAMPQESRSR